MLEPQAMRVAAKIICKPLAHARPRAPRQAALYDKHKASQAVLYGAKAAALHIL